MTDNAINMTALGRLLQTIGGDVDDLRDLLGDYEEDAPALAAAIVKAAREGDDEALRVAAHTLKSNARDFGAARLSDLCEDLERACRVGGADDAIRAAEEIAAVEREARRALGQVDLDRLSA